MRRGECGEELWQGCVGGWRSEITTACMVRFLSLSNAEYKKTIAHITNILYPPLLPTRRHYGASNQTKRSVGRASLHHFSKHFYHTTRQISSCDNSEAETAEESSGSQSASWLCLFLVLQREALALCEKTPEKHSQKVPKRYVSDSEPAHDWLCLP